MISSILTLSWQLFVLFACCLAVGSVFRFLLPKEFSLLPKILFFLTGGLFLVVLIPQNLVYLRVPVRISAWLILAMALAQLWWCRRDFVAGLRTFWANVETRTLAVVTLLTITFHGIVPIQQGLQWYYGKGYPDYSNYVQLAEFLKEVPYSTGGKDIGLRPWMLKPAMWLKDERIGQSIITAEMSVWSGTDAKGSYAATVIFDLTLLAICLYVFLRETGIDCYMAGSGALLAALLPAVTRLSLNGFLSQVSILFVFPFFACLLRRQDLLARSFTLFFGLALAYLVAAYSEIAPIGFCTLFLGVIFVRGDSLRSKRLTVMAALLLVVFVNPFYLRNLIAFLWRQYSIAGNGASANHMAPDVLTLPGWSELIFGTVTSSSLAWIFDFCTILFGVMFFAGAILLSKRDRPILVAILLPAILLILYLATRAPSSYYAMAKITLSVLPFAIALVFVALARVAANNQHRPIRVLKKLFSALIVAAAAGGSLRYYSEVLHNEGLLSFLREPRFLKVCRELEEIQNKRIFLFENDPLLTPWLCYHARHNEVYVDAKFTMDLDFLRLAPFSKAPDFKTIDFTVTPDRIVDLRDTNRSGVP
jgi:hypothetical protein